MSKGKCLGEFEQLVCWRWARLGDEAYWMSLRREIQRCSGRHVAIGAVYATLERLWDKGYLRDMKGDTLPERDGRARKFSALTAGEIRVLEEARALQEKMWTGLKLNTTRSRA